MQLLRRFAAFIFTSVFFSSLLFIAYGWTFNETIARSDTVKSWVERSGAYESFVSELAAAAGSQDTSDLGSLDLETLTTAADNSFTPNRLQVAFETFLDGVYDWLSGETEDIQFTIDFSAANADFNAQLTAFARDRLVSLPTCTDFTTLSVDPFTAECLPPGSDAEALAIDFERQLAETGVSPVANQITQADIQPEDDADFEQTLSYVPIGWQIARLGVVIAIIAAFISAGLLFVVAVNKRRILVRYSRGFLYGAITLGIFTFITARSEGTIENALSVDPAASGFAANVIEPIIQVAASDLASWTFRFTLAYAALAVILFLLYLYRHSHSKVEQKQRREKLAKTPREKLEKSYRHIVKKKPKEYAKTNRKRKETLKKEVTEKSSKRQTRK